MNIKPLLLSLSIGAFFSAATLTIQAAEAIEKERHVKVFINKSNDSQPMVDLNIDNEPYKFELPVLEEGESRTITTDNGKQLTLTQKSGKTMAQIGDEEIMLFSPKGSMGAKFMNLHAASEPNTLLISGTNLTEDEKTMIKNALQSAGIKKTVAFAETSVIHLEDVSTMDWVGDKDGKKMEIHIEHEDHAPNKEVKIIKKVEKK